MNNLSVGQKKFLSEFLGNFSIAWLVAGVISPFSTGKLLIFASWPNILFGIINALWAFILAISIVKEVSS